MLIYSIISGTGLAGGGGVGGAKLKCQSSPILKKLDSKMLDVDFAPKRTDLVLFVIFRYLITTLENHFLHVVLPRLTQFRI